MARAAKLEFKKRRLRGLTGNELKLIACFCMLCDHIGYVLIENGVLYGRDAANWAQALATPEGQRWYLLALVLRHIGTLAFPIFAYMIVEGVLHTGNVRKYMRNLLVCALVSEVPFDLACYHQVFFPYYQNVCFTLLFGVGAIQLMRWGKKLNMLCALLLGAVVCALAQLLRFDYGAAGVGLIIVLWLCRRDHSAQMWCGAVISGLVSTDYHFLGALAFPFLYFYNGKLGNLPLKYFFNAFYPLHLLVFYLLVYFGNR